jgi:D-alanine-D-alanine ligase
MKSILVLCGGKSPEHEISIRSAKNILGAIDRKKYEITLVGIDRAGSWRLIDENELGSSVEIGMGKELSFVPGRTKGQIIKTANQEAISQPDAVFLILHGPHGEDGTVQGLLRVLDLPFVGPDVLASAVAMDKEFAKRLMKEAGINVASGIVCEINQQDDIEFEDVEEVLGMPVFVKPANMGSSVGVHKVTSAIELQAAVADAFLFDRKIIIEEMIYGRELECAVLGNENPKVSRVGEVVTDAEYSYEAKYISETAAKIQIPAEVSTEELKELRATAKLAYRALGCEGMSRVDMFLTPNGEIYVNEINTIPGFTSISMYPKLWEVEGLSYPELIEELINYSIERHEAQMKLKLEV